MQKYYSDKKGKKFVSLAGLLLTILIIVLLNILRMYIADKFPQYLPDMTRVRSLPEKVIMAVMMLFAVIYLVFIILILPMWYKRFKYVIYDNRIVSYSGLFSRTYCIMRLDAIQHATLLSTPFSKYTSFNFIRLSALGGNIIMFFLSDSDCQKIMDTIDKFTAERMNAPEKQRRKSPAVKPTAQSVSEQPEKYEETDGGQLTLPEIADIIKHEMSQLAFFDTAPPAAEKPAVEPTAPDSSQISFFDGDAVQLSFEDNKT